MALRPPAPQDILIEKGVLASIFDDPDMIGVVAEVLSPEDFSEPKHEIIYRTALAFFERSEEFDILKVANRMQTDGELGRAGGLPYLLELIEPETVFANTDPVGYALMVQELSRARQLDLFGKTVSEKTLPGSGYTPDDAIAFAQQELRRISEMGNISESYRAGDLLEDLFKEIEYKSTLDNSVAIGVPTGFIDLDSSTTGFHPSQMIILGGRPAMGKTSVALDFARNASIMGGKTTMFFSLEMGRQEVMQKVLSAHAHIEFDKIKKGNLSPSEWETMREKAQDIRNSNLIIDDNPLLTITNLRTKCLKQKSRPEGLDFVIIDYLQLMEAPKVSGSDGRSVAVSAISRGMKLLAKELEVPIVILSQLNRDVEKRPDKMPLASDLRESGSLEQDADIVLLIHRPEYYDPGDRPGQAQLIIAKHRGGPTHTVNLIPLLEFSKFANGAGKFASETPPPIEEPPDDPFGEETEVYEDPYANVPYANETVSEPDSGTPAW
ncbi:MAG: replicative DNA helicase [Enterococcus sp.]|nr:replicative DNA helicase [Enterococcus sp.]